MTIRTTNIVVDKTTDLLLEENKKSLIDIAYSSMIITYSAMNIGRGEFIYNDFNDFLRARFPFKSMTSKDLRFPDYQELAIRFNLVLPQNVYEFSLIESHDDFFKIADRRRDKKNNK